MSESWRRVQGWNYSPFSGLTVVCLEPTPLFSLTEESSISWNLEVDSNKVVLVPLWIRLWTWDWVCPKRYIHGHPQMRPSRQVPAKPGKALRGGPFRLPSLGEKSVWRLEVRQPRVDREQHLGLGPRLGRAQMKQQIVLRREGSKLTPSNAFRGFLRQRISLDLFNYLGQICFNRWTQFLKNPQNRTFIFSVHCEEKSLRDF